MLIFLFIKPILWLSSLDHSCKQISTLFGIEVELILRDLGMSSSVFSLIFDKTASHPPLHYWLDAEKDSSDAHYCHCLQTGSLSYSEKKKTVDLIRSEFSITH